MKSFARRLTDMLPHTKILVLIGLFVVLGGVSFAAVKLPSDSTRQVNGDSAVSKNQSGNANGQSGSASANGGAAIAGAKGNGKSNANGTTDGVQVLKNRKSNTLQSLTLQPGRYLVKSSGEIANNLRPFKKKRRTECSLLKGSTVLVSANAFNGAYDNKNPEGSPAAVESIAMEARVKLTRATAITLSCTPKNGRTRASMSLVAQRQR